MRAADLHRLARSAREIALVATQNVGNEQVSAGELAVVEDVAGHPGTTIGEVAARTNLAQSLVSRIARAMQEAGIFAVRRDEHDRRKTRLSVEPAARRHFVRRGDQSIHRALLQKTPGLSDFERKALEEHLEAAADLLRRGS